MHNQYILVKYVFKYGRETRTTGSNVPFTVAVVFKTAGVLSALVVSGAVQDNGVASHEHSKVAMPVIQPPRSRHDFATLLL